MLSFKSIILAAAAFAFMASAIPTTETGNSLNIVQRSPIRIPIDGGNGDSIVPEGRDLSHAPDEGGGQPGGGNTTTGGQSGGGNATTKGGGLTCGGNSSAEAILLIETFERYNKEISAIFDDIS